MKGRYPKPDKPHNVHLLTGPAPSAGPGVGTPGGGQVSGGGDGRAAKLPAAECPKHITGKAAELWKALAPDMAALGRLTTLALPNFELLCVTWQRIHECNEIIAAEGLTYKVAPGRDGDVDIRVEVPPPGQKRKRGRPRKERAASKGGVGLLKKHPITGVLREQYGIWNSLSAQFGMTPATEQRLNTGQLDLFGDDDGDVFGPATAAS